MSKPSANALLKSMRQKIVTLLKIEGRMSLAERECQQWQLLFQIGKRSYVIGKGGANTMFHIVNDGERELLLPHDMIALIDTWIAASGKPYFAILDPDGKVVKRDLEDKEAALKYKTKPGYFVARIADGKKQRLYVRQGGIMGSTWKAYKK